MPILPSGTVTFLFTDIEGSTRLWEQYPEAMKIALARHDALLRDEITRRRGHIFKTVGDAFYAAFAAAPDALAAAQAAQQKLASEMWELPNGLRIRIALHTGTADERDGDYFGPTLNRVSRLLSAGHGGQVLISETTRALAEHDMPTGVNLRDLGHHRLKDLARPERIFQLIAPGLPTDFPSIKSLDTLPNNLPRQLTSFVGREHEMKEVKRLLSSTYLLTLTGTGGCGKTRLALQVAADLVEEFADGVWLAELESLSDPTLVARAVASALDVREESPRRPIMETLADFLRPKSLLLLLDNCEHLLSACARLTDSLLRDSPHLRILATSQEGMGIAGELTYRVPSLSLPDPQRLPPLEHLMEYAAVRLFVDRAVFSEPRFALTERIAPVVVQVCHRLDGIPLAIELAAARIKVMSVEQIAERLDDRFRLLTAGSRTALPRHQTLRAALDWSYDLLSEKERTLLRRLSVFAGGFTLEAAEAVCTAEHADRPEVFDLLTHLVDKSLVVFDGQGEEARYRLLETVRLYSRDHLRASGEEQITRSRHRDWYLNLAERAESELQGSKQGVWLDRLEAEHDNLRAALESSRSEENGAETGLRLAGSLWRFWEVRGYWSEGREWLEGALSKSTSAESPVRVKALSGAAYLAFFQGDYGRAREQAEESLALSRRLGDKRSTASCLNILGFEACRVENYVRARTLGEESLALSQEVGDKPGVGGALAVLGLVARGQGDYAKATALLTESLTHFRHLGNKVGVALILTNLGLVVRDQGDYERARTVFEETLAQFQELGDKSGIAFAQSNLGIVAWNQGDYRRAAALYKESLVLRKDLGDKRGVATSLVGLAAVASAESQPAHAASLFGAAEALRETLGITLPPFIRNDYERHVAAARDMLNDAEFATAWANGREMTLEQAIEYALADR